MRGTMKRRGERERERGGGIRGTMRKAVFLRWPPWNPKKLDSCFLIVLFVPLWRRDRLLGMRENETRVNGKPCRIYNILPFKTIDCFRLACFFQLINFPQIIFLFFLIFFFFFVKCSLITEIKGIYILFLFEW